jgi:hypothetical protein
MRKKMPQLLTTLLINATVLAVTISACGGCGARTEPFQPLELEVQADFSDQPLKFKDGNLMFVCFDALQARQVRCLGYSRDTTASLDALARQACVFDHRIPKALAWLNEHRDQKCFLFLHGYDCHRQNVPPGGFDDRFVNKRYDKKYIGTEREPEVLCEEALEKGELALREADVKCWRAIYDEKIPRADEKFGHFLAEFARLGHDLRDRTWKLGLNPVYPSQAKKSSP